MGQQYPALTHVLLSLGGSATSAAARALPRTRAPRRPWASPRPAPRFLRNWQSSMKAPSPRCARGPHSRAFGAPLPLSPVAAQVRHPSLPFHVPAFSCPLPPRPPTPPVPPRQARRIHESADRRRRLTPITPFQVLMLAQSGEWLGREQRFPHACRAPVPGEVGPAPVATPPLRSGSPWGQVRQRRGPRG